MFGKWNILNAPQTSEATIFEHKILTINSCCLFLDLVDEMGRFRFEISEKTLYCMETLNIQILLM